MVLKMLIWGFTVGDFEVIDFMVWCDVVSWLFTDISEEYITLIFKVGPLYPEDKGTVFLQNVFTAIQGYTFS
jgi:hypothetical protein